MRVRVRVRVLAVMLTIMVHGSYSRRNRPCERRLALTSAMRVVVARRALFKALHLPER